MPRWIHLHIPLLQGSTPSLPLSGYLPAPSNSLCDTVALSVFPLDLEQEDSMTLKFSVSFISWGRQDGSDSEAFASLGTLV